MIFVVRADVIRTRRLAQRGEGRLLPVTRGRRRSSGDRRHSPGAFHPGRRLVPHVHGYWRGQKPGREAGADALSRLLPSSYCPGVEGGNSSSSSFSGCTSDTLFILVKIWLISMKVLALVSGTTRKV